MDSVQVVRRRVAGVMGLLLVLLAATLVPGAAPAGGSQETKRFFYKITSPTTTVYFLGSIHFASADMYPLPEEIEAAYKDSSQLVVEADITKVDQLQFTTQMMAQGMYGEGDSLDKHLKPETLKELETFINSRGLPPALFLTMKPPLAAMMVESFLVGGLALSEEGIDLHFLNAANKAKDKKIIELESADMQMKLLLGLDDATADKWLANALKDRTQTDIKKAFKAWKEGDEKELEALTMEEEKTDADAKKLNEVMLYKRNDDMVKKIDEMLKGKEKTMVVVGAAHLFGERGILKQLEAKGYKVERPKLTTPAAATRAP